MAKLPLCPEERALKYSKYYDLPFEGTKPEDAEFLTKPISPDRAMPMSETLNFFKAGGVDKYAPTGYCNMPDGTSYSSCTVFLPNVTAQMMKWWFVWLNHPSKSVPEGNGNLKYKIWCPADHWDHHFLDENNPDAGMRICESLDLGAGAPRNDIINRNLSFDLLNIPADEIKKLEDTGTVLIIGCGSGLDEEPGGIGINIFANAEGGCVWASRGWGGWVPKDGKLVRKLDFVPGPESNTQLELTHNVLERRHLAKFLPELYADYHDKPFSED